MFEVAGVIDLGKRTMSITSPYVTVAGQTAPSPGITLIKGGIGIQTHDVILQHLRVRPGEAGAAKKSGWEVDGSLPAAEPTTLSSTIAPPVGRPTKICPHRANVSMARRSNSGGRGLRTG